MKNLFLNKLFLYILIVLTVCFSLTGCVKDGAPDEWRFFDSDYAHSLSDYHIDYLHLSYYSTEIATIYDYDDMTVLFDMVSALVLTKTNERRNDLPDDFELLCDVCFVNENGNGPTMSYYFSLSTTGEICFLRQQLAAESVVYTGYSTEILNEVNRLIELYN